MPLYPLGLYSGPLSIITCSVAELENVAKPSSQVLLFLPYWSSKRYLDAGQAEATGARGYLVLLSDSLQRAAFTNRLLVLER